MSDVHALVGAYAVDAVDDVERAAFERHLAECQTCRLELASLREAAVLLATTEQVEPPARLREQVLSGIGSIRPLPPQVAPEESSEVTPARRRFRPVALVAAAAAVIALGSGVVVWDQLTDDTSQAPTVSAADRVLAADDAEEYTQTLDGVEVTVVRSPSLNQAVLTTEAMPTPPEGKVYELWLAHKGKGMVPAGLMGGGAQQVLFEGDPASAVGAGITLEPEGGSEEPDHRPDDELHLREGLMTTPRRVAVVGSGVAGLVAAHVAAKTAEVTLYEADDRVGGHADTHQVATPDGPLAIDTGFIVHNGRTYPTLLRLFAELGVATQESEMSLSVSDDETGLEWAGALGPRGLFPSAANLREPGYLRMLTEIPRFHRRARRLLAESGDDDRTLREFLREGRFSAYFERHFMEPVVAAVWSCDADVALDYPARYLFTFLQHHGMLSVFGSPTWRTVTGGSRAYVDRVVAGLHDVRTGTKVTSVLETAGGVEVTDGNGTTTTYDACVVATHPDQALAMLVDPTPAQRALLGDLPYSGNSALLHTDTSLLPRAGGARASWNFRRVAGRPQGVTVTYDLTRLQRLPTDVHYLVTLGGEDLVDPATVIARREYAHPLYTRTSVAARSQLPEISGDRLAFAGAYHGWGFHEDGARSGLVAAERIGLRWEPSAAIRAPRTGPYDTTIGHTRRGPFRRSFTHRSHTWLVDLDDLPDHGVVASFEARDHLGDPDRSLRDNVASFLARHGVDLDGPDSGADTRGRVLMAAMPRAFGYCFNPISVFWCLGPDGAQRAVVVEVHNTYGDRHAYLVHPDERGRALTDKQMYVSPFHGTDGHYELVVPFPDDRLEVSVTLHTADGAPFSAWLHGEASDTAPLRTAPAALRTSLLIRLHGIALWLRRLPVRPRPPHHQEGVSPR